MASRLKATRAPSAKQARLRVKDRIFNAACDMFYRNGIRDVCVDAIASEAGSNKMSFYRSFASKDELVAEFLRNQARDHWEWWDAVIAPHAGDAGKQLEALIEGFVKKSCSTNTAGCALGNATIELRDATHPGYAIVHAFKTESRRRLRQLARAAGARDPDQLGDALQLVMEGGYLTRITFGATDSPFTQTAAVAKIMIDLHCGAKLKAAP